MQITLSHEGVNGVGDDGMTRVKRAVSYYHNTGSEPLKQMTVGDLLDRCACDWPDRTAIVSEHETISLTYMQARDQANKFAAGLLDLGVQKGDRLGIMGTNSIHWYIAAMAAAKAGFILVPLNPAFKEDELAYCLKKVQIKAMLVDETFRNYRHYEMVCTVVPQLKFKLPDEKIENPDPGEISILIVHSETKLHGAFRYKDILSRSRGTEKLHAAAKLVDPDDPFTILFSSGTTGLAKPTLLTHFMVCNNAYFCGKRLGYHKKHHTVCMQVPLCHIFGLVVGVVNALNFSSTIVMPSSTVKAASTIDAIKRHKCTAMYGTPTSFMDLCEMIEENMRTDYGLQEISFDVAFCAGAPCNGVLYDKIQTILKVKDVQFGYGMSETSPVMVQQTEDDTKEQKHNMVGLVSDHVEVKVVDQNGRMVPFGKVGEIWFRSYATMLGYWDDEENTKEIITVARWIKSGDLFVLHENGYGSVVGRIKDVIIRGGENIIPLEIENFLMTHPEIVEVQVYGVSDKRMGEEVAASIKIKPFTKVSEDILMHYCRGKLAHFKVPRYIVFTNDFPLTASGKVKKSLLREMLERDLRYQEKDRAKMALLFEEELKKREANAKEENIKDWETN